MAMAGRHIRHDWKNFVEWNQKSVRTVCGKTSTFNAVGIPGVTPQPEEVEVKGKKYFGWCTLCARYAHTEAGAIVKGSFSEEIHPYILPMYETVVTTTQPIYDAYMARQAALRGVR